MKLLSLFSGIGAFEKALTNLNVEYDLVGFSETDKWAIKSYCAIHNVSESLNLGDVREIRTEHLPKDIDMITHGSPCQDFSIAGKGKGGDKGSGTRSSLMWETVRIIKDVKPKYVIWENVPSLLYKTHKPSFDLYLNTLLHIGYSSKYMLLNAKNFGIPQNRERLFVVSVLNSSVNLYINRKEKFYTLKDFLDNQVDDSFYIEKTHWDRIILVESDTTPRNELVFVGGLKGKDWVGDGKLLSRNFPQGNRIYHENGIACTQTANGGGVGGSTGMYQTSKGIRKLTPKESMSLMGFSSRDYNKMFSVVPQKTKQLKLIGNSIVVPVLEEIFKGLLL